MGADFLIYVQATSPPDISSFGDGYAPLRLEPVDVLSTWPHSLAYPRGVTHRVSGLYTRHISPRADDRRIWGWQWIRPLFVKLVESCERVWVFSDYSTFDELLDDEFLFKVYRLEADQTDPSIGGADYAILDESLIALYDKAFVEAGHVFEVEEVN